MSQARYIVGDALTELANLPDASVDLVMTSPPFLALRSYLPADHPDKAKEIGSEATPGAFLDVLLDVVVELRRVLAPHGSLVVELGDTYSGSGGRGEASLKSEAFPWRETGWASEARDGAGHRIAHGEGWPLAKSLCMIPSSFAFALAYGRNPWTGRELEPWRVRNLIAWCRPNPPVGALGDKFRPGTSYLTVACVGASRYFDLDAVREPYKFPDHGSVGKDSRGDKGKPGDGDLTGRRMKVRTEHPAGAPPLDWWEIPTHPYPGSHYATFPPALVVRPVKAMCPQRVCRVCGKPSERITTVTDEYRDALDKTNGGKGRGDLGDDPNVRPTGGTWLKPARESVTLGWSDCGHDDWRAGVLLDPFAGSGTSLEVATGHGRDAIGIDLDRKNLDLARQRVGMFLEEVVPDAGTAA